MVVVRPGAQIDPIGVIAAIGANVSFSIGVVFTKRFAVQGDRLTRTGIQLLLSAIVIVPVALLVEGRPPPMSTDSIAGLGYLILLATGAAFAMWFNGIPRLPSQAPPVLGLAAPITGATLGWIVLDETLSAIQLAGFAITIGAITYAATVGSTTTPTPPTRPRAPIWFGETRGSSRAVRHSRSIGDTRSDPAAWFSVSGRCRASSAVLRRGERV